jgi:glucose-6-phosphate 1-epimerase
MYQISTKIGANGLPCVLLSSSDQLNQCTVYLFGCTVTSWISNSKENLFISDLAIFNGSKAIRGGIPIVFPQFGSPPNSTLNQHGFARNLNWDLIFHKGSEDNAAAIFSLTENEITLQQWPYKFTLFYKIILQGAVLTTELSIHNTDIVKSFEFQALLHTYLRVNNINNVQIEGCENMKYIDKLSNSTEFINKNEKLIIDKEVDRIYTTNSIDANILPDIIILEKMEENEKSKLINTTSSIQIQREAYYTKTTTILNENTNLKQQTNELQEKQQHEIQSSQEKKEEETKENIENKIKKYINIDTVVWNPWIEKSKTMADLDDNAFNNFVCVEPGLVSKFYELKSNEEVVLKQVLSIV